MPKCVTCGQVYYSKECPKCKGNAYEEYVAEHFKAQGYTVAEHGKINGVADKSIDLIIKKEREIALVQCKNYKADTTYKINHEKIKAFVGETAFYLQDNPMYESYTLKRLYVVSNPVLERSAINFIESHADKIAYLHLPFNKAPQVLPRAPEPARTRRSDTYAKKTSRKARADVVLSRNTKHKEAFAVMLLIFGVIAVLSYLGSEYLSYSEHLETARQQQLLENQQRVQHERRMESAKAEARRQALQRRQTQPSRYISSATRYSPKTSANNHTRATKKSASGAAQVQSPLAYASRPKKSHTPTKTVKPVTTRYPKYSAAIKLRSSSRIRTLPDNRMTSNAPIFGSYAKLLFSNKPNCGKKKIRDIGLVNDCYVSTSNGFDKLYLKKSWFDEFANYNSARNKKIDCDYSKKHGIFHNCKVWNI
ncbi:MAG: restriction endonuclease [Thiovulaceae bacterium]|nr:restriction endonuclease [Sulfurimonadaceae bacterium]